MCCYPPTPSISLCTLSKICIKFHLFDFCCYCISLDIKSRKMYTDNQTSDLSGLSNCVIVHTDMVPVHAQLNSSRYLLVILVHCNSTTDLQMILVCRRQSIWKYQISGGKIVEIESESLLILKFIPVSILQRYMYVHLSYCPENSIWKPHKSLLV